MDYNFSNKLEDLEEFLSLIDLSNFELKWVNPVKYHILSKEDIGNKCYKAYYGLNAPCEGCPIVKFRENLEEYASSSQNMKACVELNGHNLLIKKKVITIDGKYYSCDSVVDNKKIDDISLSLSNINFNNQVINLLQSIDISGKLEVEMKKLLTALKELYGASKASFFKNEPFSSLVIELKNDTTTIYPVDKMLKDLIMADPHNFTRKLELDKYIFVNREMLENEQLKFLLKKYNVKNFVYIEWPIDFDKYRLLLLNIDEDQRYNSLFKSIYSIVYFLITNSNHYNELKKISNTDTLTSLYNRNKYNHDIEKVSKNVIDSVGVLYLDLDNLKEINDKFGHTMGDKLITATSKILKETFKSARIYRIGGDEFVIIQYSISYEEFVNKIDIINKRFSSGNIFISYGVSYKSSGAVLDEMIHAAEKEMYVYKRRHHSKYDYKSERALFYSKVKEHDYLENFYVVLQPKIDPYSNEIVGAEALIRSNGANGWKYPNEFIPIFEKNDCIDVIDYFMLEEVCKLQRRILDKYSMSIPISINIARSTLILQSFTQDVMNLIEKYNIPLDLIRLEITERMDVSSEEIINHGMILRRYGFIIEVDDFGSHFTNLGFLSKNVFSVIKLDRSIVRTLSSDTITSKFIQFVINECHERNITVLAEGVETEEDLSNIKRMGIDEVQGYYYSKPIVVEKFIEKYIKK